MGHIHERSKDRKGQGAINTILSPGTDRGAAGGGGETRGRKSRCLVMRICSLHRWVTRQNLSLLVTFILGKTQNLDFPG